MNTLLKVYQCSISKKFEYKLINDLENYTVKSIHNNRVAIEDNVGDILWIEDRGYGLNIGDTIRFNRYGIKIYNEDGYVADTKDYNYKTRIKDIKNTKGKYFAIKSILSSCDELRKTIEEAEIDFNIN